MGFGAVGTGTPMGGSEWEGWTLHRGHSHAPGTRPLRLKLGRTFGWRKYGLPPPHPLPPPKPGMIQFQAGSTPFFWGKASTQCPPCRLCAGKAACTGGSPHRQSPAAKKPLCTFPQPPHCHGPRARTGADPGQWGGSRRPFMLEPWTREPPPSGVRRSNMRTSDCWWRRFLF